MQTHILAKDGENLQPMTNCWVISSLIPSFSDKLDLPRGNPIDLVEKSWTLLTAKHFEKDLII